MAHRHLVHHLLLDRLLDRGVRSLQAPSRSLSTALALFEQRNLPMQSDRGIGCFSCTRLVLGFHLKLANPRAALRQ
jgi:predicted hotdog family 3-hydroxylacyl-ACP dehydratase